MSNFDQKISCSVQEAHVQMHPDTNGSDMMQESCHDPVHEQGCCRPPRQWPRHRRLRKGVFSRAQHCVCVALASKMIFVIGQVRIGEKVILGSSWWNLHHFTFLFCCKSCTLLAQCFLLVDAETVVNLVVVLLFPVYNWYLYLHMDGPIV